MPDADGKLTQEDREKIAKYLDERKAQLTCPSCGTGKWSLQSHIGTIPATLKLLQPGVITYPVVILICTSCAFMRMHSAVLMGLVAKRKEEEPKQEVANV